MSAMQHFSNWVKAVGPSAAAAAPPGSATVSNDAAPVKSKSASRQAEVTKRLAALIGPYKEAISRNGPAAAQMQSRMDAAKKHIVQRDFEQAANDLDELEPLLAQSNVNDPSGQVTDRADQRLDVLAAPAFVSAAAGLSDSGPGGSQTSNSRVLKSIQVRDANLKNGPFILAPQG